MFFFVFVFKIFFLFFFILKIFLVMFFICFLFFIFLNFTLFTKKYFINFKDCSSLVFFFWKFFGTFTFHHKFFRSITYSRRYTGHTELEFAWTAVPAATVFAMSLPTLIYIYNVGPLSDEPEFVLKIVAHQWYWSYESNFAVMDWKDYIKTHYVVYDIWGFDIANDWRDIVESTKNVFLNDWIYPIDLGKNFDFNVITHGVGDKNPLCIRLVEANVFLEQRLKPDQDLTLGDLRMLETDTTLVLPVNKTIKVFITSADVIHSWTVPGLGVKVDAVPGRLNMFTINVRTPGVQYGQCSELCGVNHAFMPIKILFTTVKN